MRPTKSAVAAFCVAMLVGGLLAMPSFATTLAYCVSGGTCKLRTLTVSGTETIAGLFSARGNVSLAEASTSQLSLGADNCTTIYSTSSCTWNALEATGAISGAQLAATAGVSGTTYTSSSTAGTNALAVATNGARVDFGAGASDYMTSNGTTIASAAPFAVTGALSSTSTISSSVGSGTNGLAVTTNGARVDFGAGASDHATSDGTTVTFAGPAAVTGTVTASGIVSNSATWAGTKTLSGGTGTTTVASGARCVCTDTTANVSVKCSVSGTTLTFTGTTTDVIAYWCF